MKAKLGKFDAVKKMDYGSYQALFKKKIKKVLENPETEGICSYVLVSGEHLCWKGELENSDKKPLLFLGLKTSWIKEIKASKTMTIKSYSYGTCRIVEDGSNIEIELCSEKGKLTEEPLLKPLKKIFKSFKPKTYLEAVEDLYEEEEEEEDDLEFNFDDDDEDEDEDEPREDTIKGKLFGGIETVFSELKDRLKALKDEDEEEDEDWEEDEEDEIDDEEALEKMEEALDAVDEKAKALANAGFKLNKLLLNAIRLGVADLKFLKETEELFKDYYKGLDGLLDDIKNFSDNYNTILEVYDAFVTIGKLQEEVGRILDSLKTLDKLFPVFVELTKTRESILQKLESSDNDDFVSDLKEAIAVMQESEGQAQKSLKQLYKITADWAAKYLKPAQEADLRLQEIVMLLDEIEEEERQEKLLAQGEKVKDYLEMVFGKSRGMLEKIHTHAAKSKDAA